MRRMTRSSAGSKSSSAEAERAPKRRSSTTNALCPARPTLRTCERRPFLLHTAQSSLLSMLARGSASQISLSSRASGLSADALASFRAGFLRAILPLQCSPRFPGASSRYTARRLRMAPLPANWVALPPLPVPPPAALALTTVRLSEHGRVPARTGVADFGQASEQAPDRSASRKAESTAESDGDWEDDPGPKLLPHSVGPVHARDRTRSEQSWHFATALPRIVLLSHHPAFVRVSSFSHMWRDSPRSLVDTSFTDFARFSYRCLGRKAAKGRRRRDSRLPRGEPQFSHARSQRITPADAA